MQNDFLISIIIPTFNRAIFISQTLQSILYQSYTNWECIIIDDGSTDGTQNAILEFVKKDNRFKFYQRYRAPKGAPVCRNIGIEMSKGDYITFQDSDDVYKNDFLKNAIFQFRSNSNIDGCFFKYKKIFISGEKIILPKQRPINSIISMNDIIPRNIIPIQVVLKRKSLDSHRFNENLKQNQDWILWLEMINDGMKFKLVNKVNLIVNQVENSISNKSEIYDNILSYEIIVLKYKNHLLKYQYKNFIKHVIKGNIKNKNYINAFMFILKLIRNY